MFGGVRNIGGDTIAETTLLHLGEFAVWNTCLHKFPPQSEVSQFNTAKLVKLYFDSKHATKVVS